MTEMIYVYVRGLVAKVTTKLGTEKNYKVRCKKDLCETMRHTNSLLLTYLFSSFDKRLLIVEILLLLLQ